jgi:dipeptidyl-peptidase-4
VPLIVNPYGGPGVQTVANRWSDSLLFDELLAQHGFAVLHADNRGMGSAGAPLPRRLIITSVPSS